MRRSAKPKAALVLGQAQAQVPPQAGSKPCQPAVEVAQALLQALWRPAASTRLNYSVP